MMTAPRLGRAPWVSAGPMTAEQERLAELICRDWGGGAVGLSPVDEAGRLLGPFDLFAAGPAVGESILAMLDSFTASSLTKAERELVIVLVAARRECEFMWLGHVDLLAEQGMDPAEIERIAEGSRPSLSASLEGVYELVVALLERGDLSDEEFAAAEQRLGWVKMQEIIWLAGIYMMFALAMRVARTPVPTAATLEHEERKSA